MSAFLQQVFTLLTTEAGSLTYHLVLAFAIAGAIPGAIHQTRIPGVTQSGRMIVGLVGLLVFQLILFASTGLIWQGLFNPGDLLPLIDRSVILLSLVLVIWLWAFPEPNRRGDAMVVFLALIAIAYVALAGVWWFDQPISTPFAGTWIDKSFDYLALGLAGLATLLLLIRRPVGWGLGLAMIIGLAIGHLLNLFALTPNSDYSGAIRLAQMASYPLLLALPSRAPLVISQELALRPSPAVQNNQLMVADRRNIPLDIKTLRAVLDVSANGSLESISSILAKVTAHSLVADVCLLVTPPDPMGNMNVLGGYDLIRERTLPKISLGKDLTPTLGIALQNNQVLRLPASSGSAEMVYLGHRLSVQKVGHLMAVPIQKDAHGSIGGIVILSPYTMRTWNDDDQTRLTELAESTAAYLVQFDEIQSAKGELQGVQEAFELLKSERDSLLSDQQILINRVQEYQSKAVQVEPNEELQTLREELRLTLQEVALLSSAQSAYDYSENGAGLSKDDFAEIMAVAEELRQPMSSLVGYTDVLLAESHGILGERQRKIVERIRIANERMTRLLDELIGNLNIEDAQYKQADLKDVDLMPALQVSIDETEPLRTPRKIGVRIKIPEKLPAIQVNPLALHKALNQLLQNASWVSAPNSNIFIQAQLKQGEGDFDYILLQITDSGNGFAREELSHIFSNLSGAGETLADGGANGTNLFNVKTLVESFGGRILIDSNAGRGTTFSLLLPVKVN